MNPDVIIAGGGIGGAVLAALLTRGGKRVLIVERAKGPPPFLRPEILWPRAVETLFSLKPREFWEKECIRPVGGITLDRGGRLRPVITQETFQRAGVQPFFEQPNHTRETLLGICGAELRRGVEVVQLLRDGDGKRVLGLRARVVETGEVFEVESALTVGDDGGDSKVRAGCGIALKRTDFPAEFFACALPWPADWAPDVVRLISPRGVGGGFIAFGVMPLPGGKAAGVVIIRAGFADDEIALAGTWNRIASAAADMPPELRECGFPQKFTRIRRPWGHAASYGVDGAVLLGDAIHPVTPAGGQGANMAIADAAVLARLILDGDASLVAKYHAERHTANARGVRPSRLASHVFRIIGVPLLGALPGLMLPWLAQRQGIAVRLLRSLAGQ